MACTSGVAKESMRKLRSAERHHHPDGVIAARSSVHKVINKPYVHKYVHKWHENGPRRVLRGPFYLVALSRFSPNTSLTDAKSDADGTDRSSSFFSPLSQRRRVTARLRAVVVEAYESGQSSRQVAGELMLGRTTVLKILKAAGVPVRPPGHR